MLYDIHGDAWVYEDLGGNALRAQTGADCPPPGGFAVIARGLPEGVKVVTAGAAELFGTEFGAGH